MDTGMSVPASKQNCKAATDFIAANPNSPEYFDSVFVWDNVPDVTETTTTCTPGQTTSVTTTTVITEGWTPKNTVRELNDTGYPLAVTVNPNQTAKLIFTAQRTSDMWADFIYADGSSSEICSKTRVRGGRTVFCNEGQIANGAVRIAVYVDRRGGGRNAGNSSASATLELTTTNTTPELCTTVTDTTDGNANWRDIASLLIPDASGNQSIIEAVECDADHGVHGISDASTEKYPQYYSTGGALDTPNYDVGNVGTAVNWSTAPQRYIVPGNYHDYLQTPTDTLLGASGTVTDLNILSGKDERDSAEQYCLYGHSNWGLSETNRRDKYIRIGLNIYQCRQRVAIMKEATTDLLNTMTGVNVGVMRFNYNARHSSRDNHGGTLVSAVKNIDEGTNKQDAINAVLRLTADGNTPLQEALYEAYSYFAGKPLASPDEYLQRAAVGSTVDQPTSLSGAQSKNATDSAGKTSSNVYKSPIKNFCQDNNIILFSDGEPTQDTARRTEINAFSGPNCGSSNGECLDELAGAMASNKVNESLTKMNNVYTHTISFASDIDILKTASNSGLKPGAVVDSQYHQAGDTSELQTAFQKILLSIKKVKNDSFVAPAVSVDAYSRRQNNDELYYALFEPNNRPRWKGNIKKYKINGDGKILDARSTDSNPIEAIDPSTGFFKDDSQSYWVDSSDPIDGADVAKGGAARQLDILARPRKLFVNLIVDDDYKNTNSDYNEVNLLETPTKLLAALYDNDDDGEAEIDNDGNLIIDTTDVEIGVIGGNVQEKSDNANNIIKWTLGQDVDLDNSNDAAGPNYYLGETLHGTPYLLSYGISADDPKNVLFATTNQGIVHAIDADDGEELWAYIPDKDLFKNLGSYYNQVVDSDHTYGLDTEIAFHIERLGQNNKVSNAQLFFGQRRGGKKYFAIDVTDSEPSDAGSYEALVDPNGAPLVNDAGNEETPVKKLWTIKGGSGGTPGFESMGETWAKPIATKANYCESNINSCAVTDVVFLSGGYDSAQYDNYSDLNAVTISNQADGNDIYMVEKDTGKLLWRASSASFPDGDNAHMNHSFPSEPALIDSDFDGVVDLMFVLDISGQLWRFDFRGHFDVNATGEVIGIDDNGILNYNKTENTTAPSVSGGIVAKLRSSAENKRFYNTPAVSSIAPVLDVDKNIVEKSKFVITAGSGYRAHPLDDSDATNGIYFVYDRNRIFPALATDSSDKATGKISYRYGSGTDPLKVGASSDIKELSYGEELETGPNKDHYYGFYYKLGESSEKIINPVFIRNGVAISTSYIPPNSGSQNNSGDVCESTTGTGNLYTTDLGTGETTRINLSKSGIAARPVVLKLDPTTDNASGLVVCVGTECFGTDPNPTVNGTGLNTSGKVKLPDDSDSLVEKINWWEDRYK